MDPETLVGVWRRRGRLRGRRGCRDRHKYESLI